MKLRIDDSLWGNLTESKEYNVMFKAPAWMEAARSFIIADDGVIIYIEELVYHHNYFTLISGKGKQKSPN